MELRPLKPFAMHAKYGLVRKPFSTFCLCSRPGKLGHDFSGTDIIGSRVWAGKKVPMAKASTVFETPFDTYSVISMLGEGGAGRVYLVRNRSGKEFALKCLAPERVSSERLKRFQNEINFCQKTDHPNIVKILDTGAAFFDGKKCPFYVMERYSGTMRTLMGVVRGDEIVRLFSQLLDGVEAAHLTGVWHRDLKPENVLHDQKCNRLAVADFGIAHFEEEELYTVVVTKPDARLANFQYSSPEQRVRNQLVDHRADIFALGLILNEMFTGAIIQGSGSKKIAAVDNLYSYLDELVDLMTQQDPANRPGSVADIKKELIGRKQSFIALQKLDEAKRRVVKVADPPDFVPIEISSFDYQGGLLILQLNRDVPYGWTELFRNPRGGLRFTMGFSPANYNIRGNRVTISIEDGGLEAQRAYDHAKRYISEANTEYVAQLVIEAKEEEQRQRAELEKQVAEAERRKNVMTTIRL